MAGQIQHRFDPYSSNGGSILAIAGKDFAVIAGDTRQSEGYSIQSRYQKKVWPLTSKAILAVNGFAADGNNFVKRVKQRLEWYSHSHNKEMPIKSIARLIQTMLYARRMFPYYVYNVLSGIEEDGTGAVYSFDPVGSYERETCRAAGAAQSLLQPFLDNQIYFRNHTPAPNTAPLDSSAHPLSSVLSILVDSFTSATERHIEVGDGLEGYVICAPGRSVGDLVGEAVKEGDLPKGMIVQEVLDDADDDDALEGGSSGGSIQGQRQGKKCRVFLVKKELKRD